MVSSVLEEAQSRVIRWMQWVGVKEYEVGNGSDSKE